MAQLLNITPEEYHARPGFSASVAKTLISRSPLHAWQEHPEYGGVAKDPTKSMDIGTVIHKMVLGKGTSFRPLDFRDWRTDKAKEARQEARDEGVVPILAEDHKEATFAAIAIMRALIKRGIKLDGSSEQAMEWHEQTPTGPLLCRGMLDHLTSDMRTIFDLKVTEDASPRSIERTAENFGHAIQHAAYMSGIAKVNKAIAGRVTMRFIFVEPNRPYAVNIVEPDGVFRELGERRWERACNAWARCVKDNEWPGYGEGVEQITAPAWALSQEGYTTDER